MANIFRANEVYKKPSKFLHDKNEMIPVRGVYVTGEYRPPYYSDSGLTLTSISSTSPTIVNFIDEYKDITDNTLGFSNIDCSINSVEYVRFTNDMCELNPTNTIGFSNINCSINNIELYRFEKDHKDIIDNTLGFANVEFSLDAMQIIRYNESFKSNTPMPILRLINISSETATITDYN